MKPKHVNERLEKFQTFLKTVYGNDLIIEQTQGITKVHAAPSLELQERETQLIQWMYQTLQDKEQTDESKTFAGWKQLVQYAWQYVANQSQNVKNENSQTIQRHWIQEQFRVYNDRIPVPAYLIYIQLTNEPTGTAPSVVGQDLAEWMQLIIEVANTDIERCHVVPINEWVAGIVLYIDEHQENDLKLEGVIEECKSWLDLLLAELYLDATIGVSSLVETSAQILDGMEQALQAWAIGGTFYGSHGVYAFGQLGLQRMIYDLVKRELVDCEALLPRQQYEMLGNELRETALSFFRNHLNISETARVLYLHRNSLLYRLDKIREITGFDIRKFEEAVALWMALNLWRITMS